MRPDLVGLLVPLHLRADFKSMGIDLDDFKPVKILPPVFPN